MRRGAAPAALLLLTLACDKLERQQSTTQSACLNPSVAQQVGATLMIGFEGTRPEDWGVQKVKDLAESGQIAGVLLLGYNIVDPAQLQRLTEAMHRWNTPRRFIVAVDEEGGNVARLAGNKGFPRFIDAQSAGENHDLHVCDGISQLVSSMGVTLNLAPVVDMAINPSGPAIGSLRRSYGRTSPDVVAWGRACVLAHRKAGVFTALKHFPGHGSAGSDSHQELTDVTDVWTPLELQPFYELIAAGLADSIMTAHLTHTGLDARWPLSLSPTFIQETLRQHAGYDGPIVSDALDMGALWHNYALEDITVGALRAGNDLLVFSMNAAARGAAAHFDAIDDLPQRALDAVQSALDTNRLTHQQLYNAYRRAITLAGVPAERPDP